MRRLAACVALLLAQGFQAACQPQPQPQPQALPQAASARSSAEVIAAAAPSEWRRIDPQNTVYMDLPAGRVIIELAPGFAPNHVANIRALIRAGYFDQAAIVRAQDNYVVQWSQPDEKRGLGAAHATLPAEFARRIDPAAGFAPLVDPDTYAPQVGFTDGFPSARDPASGQTWLTHCYGMVGAGRDVAADSGGGAELYAVIGQSPRHLDRNVTLVGRVVQGMALLSVMPRGTGDLGFYKTPQERTPILKVRLAADLPPGEQVPLEALRTDSPSFRALIQAQRHRGQDWFKDPADRLGICNAALPVRVRP